MHPPLQRLVTGARTRSVAGSICDYSGRLAPRVDLKYWSGQHSGEHACGNFATRTYRLLFSGFFTDHIIILGHKCLHIQLPGLLSSAFLNSDLHTTNGATLGVYMVSV